MPKIPTHQWKTSFHATTIYIIYLNEQKLTRSLVCSMTFSWWNWDRRNENIKVEMNTEWIITCWFRLAFWITLGDIFTLLILFDSIKFQKIFKAITRNKRWGTMGGVDEIEGKSRKKGVTCSQSKHMVDLLRPKNNFLCSLSIIWLSAVEFCLAFLSCLDILCSFILSIQELGHAWEFPQKLGWIEYKKRRWIVECSFIQP